LAEAHLGRPASAAPLVASATWPVRSGLVPHLADRFSTRPETAPDLGAAFSSSRSAALVPSCADESGWPQVCGKTQLAAFYAESLWQAHAIDLLVWIDASSRAALLAGYVQAAAAVAGTRPAGPAHSVAASLVAWLASTKARWLVVLDDLADGAMPPELRPAGRTGQLLVTAPDRQVVKGIDEVLVLEVGPFSRREAMSYLVARLSADPDQRHGAMDLVEDLGGEPLALAQASAVIASSRMTCDGYRERFHWRMVEMGVAAAQEARRQAAPSVTWTLSLDRASQMLPGGATDACLAMAALTDGHGVPDAVFTTAAGSTYIAGVGLAAARAQDQARTALLCLERVGLLTIDQRDELAAVRMGGVLQQAVRAATPQEMRDQAGRAVAAALLEIWPEVSERACAPLGLRASADTLRARTADLLWDGRCDRLLFLAGQSLDEAQLSAPAVEYWSELASVAARLYERAHPDSIAIFERLASAYVADGRVAEAVAWCNGLIDDWARDYAPQSDALPARVGLGRALTAAGLPREAVGVLAAALEDCESTLGLEHPQSQQARDELAAAYTASGQHDESIQILRRALGERERRAGTLDPGTIATRRMLAEAYLAADRVKDAMSQYKKALSDIGRSQGADHPNTIRMRGALGAAYHRAGRMALAVQMYEETHTASSRTLGPAHPDTLASAISLADVYYAVGRLTDAARLYQDAIAQAERVLPAGHPLLQSARDKLAVITG
jgi:tetratricopeptide (TPR) repeat protein